MINKLTSRTPRTSVRATYVTLIFVRNVSEMSEVPKKLTIHYSAVNINHLNMPKGQVVPSSDHFIDK